MLPPRTWRTLVRATRSYAIGSRKLLLCVIPGWNPSVQVAVDRASLPEDWGELALPMRFFARVNIEAESEEDLVIDGPFERAPVSLDYL